MNYINKYVTISYKNNIELNEQLKKHNLEGWEVISVNNKDTEISSNQKTADVLLRKIDEGNNGDTKKLLNG